MLTLTRALLALFSAQVPYPPPPVAPFPIAQWDANTLPRYYERSDQLPLTDDELLKLSKAGFEPKHLVKMIEERRCACDASADGLIRLKKSGLSPDVLAAVSLHALPPNRSLTVEVTLDFAGEGDEARDGYFYFFVDDGDVTRSFVASVGEMLEHHHPHEESVDRSDLLLEKRVRRIHVAGDIALKTYGKHTLLVAFSANPSVLHPSQLRPDEREKAQGYTFDYPRSSLESVCRLGAAFKRDALLTYRWHFQGSQFACEWM